MHPPGASQPGGPQRERRAARRSELVVLVADDSAAIRHYLVALLRQNGVDRVLEAVDGVDALKVLRDAEPRVNVVFCDLDMPTMDGVDTLRRIALVHRDVSVVVFSAMDPRVLSTVAQMSEVQGLEVLGVLPKPFSEEDVQKQLDRWRRARREGIQLQPVECTPAEIESALAENRIEVHYQPKALLADGRVVSVEALVRLRDPYLGCLKPALFLHAAERCGLMPAITRRVLEQGLDQINRWDRSGLVLGLSVNMAPSVLRRLDWPDVIVALAADFGVDPDRVTLEVTEQHVDASTELLHNAVRFRIKGLRLSVDDFGTGDSGLARLRALPFTELKVDRSFIAEAATREDLRTLLQTSIDLARRMHMQVVAEGVETWEQWHLLREFGCDAAQGHLISPSLPGDAIPGALHQWYAARAAASRPALAGVA